MITKDVLFAVLTTFCLCALLFAVTPIRSAIPYDPWSDTFDENGKIDMKDIGYMASQFMTSGDPTKNVSIAGRANRLAYSNWTDIPAGSDFYSAWVSVDGYSKISICMYHNINNNTYTLQARHSGALAAFTVERVNNLGNNLVWTYDVPNQEIRVFLRNGDAGLRSIILDIYLIR